MIGRDLVSSRSNRLPRLLLDFSNVRALQISLRAVAKSKTTHLLLARNPSLVDRDLSSDAAARFAIGTKQTCRNAQSMSLLGVKRTYSFALHMSANDPKRTLDWQFHPRVFSNVSAVLVQRWPMSSLRDLLCSSGLVSCSRNEFDRTALHLSDV